VEFTESGPGVLRIVGGALSFGFQKIQPALVGLVVVVAVFSYFSNIVGMRRR